MDMAITPKELGREITAKEKPPKQGVVRGKMVHGEVVKETGGADKTPANRRKGVRRVPNGTGGTRKHQQREDLGVILHSIGRRNR